MTGLDLVGIEILMKVHLEMVVSLFRAALEAALSGKSEKTIFKIYRERVFRHSGKEDGEFQAAFSHAGAEAGTFGGNGIFRHNFQR